MTNTLQIPLTEPEKKKPSVVLSTAMFGLYGLFFAGHLVLNGKYLSMLGDEGDAASALMSTFQSVVLGSAVGCLLGVGLSFGSELGQKHYREAGNDAKVGRILAMGLGTVVALTMLSTRLWFPLAYNASTAKIASEFFTTYAPASLPLLDLIVTPQVSFQEGEWAIPPASMFMVMLFSGVASYLFGFSAGMGAPGIGLGGTIGSLMAASVVSLWLCKKRYAKYELYTGGVHGFANTSKKLLTTGVKLAFQRLTEWANAFMIASIIGAYSNDLLKALNPSMLYIVLFGTAQQGYAQAAGMVVSKHKGAIKDALDKKDNALVQQHHHDIVRAVYRSNAFVVIFNALVAMLFITCRKPLTSAFLASDSSNFVKETATSLFVVTMVGLIPDGSGIVQAGSLRGWKDLMYPTYARGLAMSALAVPAAWLTSLALGTDTIASALMVGRNVGMLIAAGFILKRCVEKLNSDETLDLAGKITKSSFFKLSLPKQLSNFTPAAAPVDPEFQSGEVSYA